MKDIKPNISDKAVAYNGAILAIAGVFVYSIFVMIYTIIRSSATIYSIMPKEERNTIIFASGFSVAYSVAVFSLLMAALSSVAGLVAAVIIKKTLLYFNPLFNFGKAVLICCITALALLTIMYLVLYFLLKDWMTSNYPETLLFWFLFPASIFLVLCITGGSKLNRVLDTGSHH